MAGGPEQGGMDPKLEEALKMEMSLRNEQSRGMYLSDLDRFKKSLTELDMAKTEEEREMARERAYEHFDEIKKQELGHLEFITDKHMSFEFAFPYDSRQGAVWFMAMRRDLEDTLALDEDHGGFKEDSEARKWVENLYDAVVWGDGNYGVQEGLNTINYYFGGFDAMAAGLQSMKLRITSTKMADANSRDVRGAGSNEKSAEGLMVAKGKVLGSKKLEVPHTYFDKKLKKKVTETRQVDWLVKQKEAVENIREIGVSGQDEFYYWRNLVAAVAQYDYAQPNKDGLMRANKVRQGLEVDFVVQLFGKKEADGRTPKMVASEKGVAPDSILSFFTMADTKKNRREYRQLMMALMECKAMDKLAACNEETDPNKPPRVNLAQMQVLLNEVKDAKDRIAKREQKKAPSTEDRIRSVVVKNGLIFDIASGGSGPMAWQFEYKMTRNKRGKDGKVIPGTGRMVRRVDFGGINQAGDWYTPEFWLLHNLLYDKTSRLRSKKMLATPDRYRKAVLQEKSPFEKPLYSLEEAKKIDPWQYNEVQKIVAEDDEEILVSGDDDMFDLFMAGGLNEKQKADMRKAGRLMKAGDWREQNKFRIDPVIREALKDAVWFQEIPYPIGTNSDGSPVFPLFATFIPPRFKMSFFDHVKTRDEKGRQVTMQDRLRNADLKLSEVDYENDLKEHQWDRWLVNMNMGERLLRFAAEPGDPRAEEAILGGTGTLKEGIKRTGLHNRDSFYAYEVEVPDASAPGGKRKETRYAPGSFFELVLVGQMNMLHAVKGNPRARDASDAIPTDLISPAIEDDEFSNRWENIVMPEYINAAKYLTPDTGEDEGTPEFYNETLAILMAVTGNSLFRMALEGGSNSVHDKMVVVNQLRTMKVDRKKRLVKRGAVNFTENNPNTQLSAKVAYSSRK